jgi:hypothetical protein
MKQIDSGMKPSKVNRLLASNASSGCGEQSALAPCAQANQLTEQKRAEGALRRSEAYLAEAQALSHSGSCSAQSAPLWIKPTAVKTK